MSEFLTLTVGGLTALTLIAGMIAAAVRLVLLPWLREHLVRPMKVNADLAEEVHRQVTVNSHKSPEPTLLDKIDTLQQNQHAAAQMFEGHIERSAEEWGRIWDAIDHLKNRNRP